MATETGSGNNGMLYFLVGILVVGVAIIAYFMFSGNRVTAASGPEAAIERSADALGDAADKVGDAAERTKPDGG